jgi:hypothetical protein
MIEDAERVNRAILNLRRLAWIRSCHGASPRYLDRDRSRAGPDYRLDPPHPSMTAPPRKARTPSPIPFAAQLERLSLSGCGW